MYDEAIKNLQTCSAIDDLTFYVSCVDDKVNFGVRLRDGLKNLHKDEAQRLVDKLNEVTAPIREEFLRKHREKVVTQFLGGRDLTTRN